MTFFANSGVTWPNLEPQTRAAGRNSFSGASKLYEILAELEGDEGRTIGENLAGRLRQKAQDASKELLSAAETYRGILSELDGFYRAPLTPGEIDLAAVDRYNVYVRGLRDRLYEDRFPRQPRGGEYYSRRLYEDLATRLKTLASMLESFHPIGKKEDLAASVFAMMREWESLSALARVIAVMNRREDGRL